MLYCMHAWLHLQAARNDEAGQVKLEDGQEVTTDKKGQEQILQHIKKSMALNPAAAAAPWIRQADTVTKIDPRDLEIANNLFNSSLEVNQTLTECEFRMNAYRDAIEWNKDKIRGKIVLDVACGTGILSLLVANAGARKVIAIEPSDLADCAKQVMIDNKMDHVVTVHKGRLEDMKKLPDGVFKVDVIISEFMGYSIFYESRMDTVVFARDKWLVSGGLILPDRCTFSIFGVYDLSRMEHYISWWTDSEITGISENISYEPMIELSRKRPRKYRISHEKVVTNVYKLMEFDLNTIESEDLEFQKCQYEIKLRNRETTAVNGLGTCFDVKFPARDAKDIRIWTSPFSYPTCYEQTVFFFSREVTMLPATSLYGIFAFRKHPLNPHDYEFSIMTKYNGSNEEFTETNKYQYEI